MAITGTITSGQGTQTLSSSPYDQLTITVSSGTYSVEYPVGTPIATGATTTATYQIGGGQCRITVNSGSVNYSLDQIDDNLEQQKYKVMTAAELSVLAAAGSLIPYATYIASDSPTKDEWRAIDAYTLVPTQVTETSPYVTLTANGLAFNGPCELAGYYGSVAAGNITIYDALSAVGTPVVPLAAVVAGPNLIYGAGTNGKMLFATGCYVVLSGAATVRVMVGGV